MLLLASHTPCLPKTILWLADCNWYMPVHPLLIHKARHLSQVDLSFNLYIYRRGPKLAQLYVKVQKVHLPRPISKHYAILRLFDESIVDVYAAAYMV